MLTGENGILTQAQRAKEETESAQAKEENILSDYESFLNIYGGENTEFTDSLGNKVKVPAGFKVVNPEDNVEDGIVIEDVVHGATAGSQFVWIPVGKDIKKKDGTTFDITLGRYVFNTDGSINEELSVKEPTEQLKESLNSEYFFTEGLKGDINSVKAKDIVTFISKVNSSGGYYVGRYEARDGTVTLARTSSTSDTNQLTVKANNYVYNYVTQMQAASLSQKMYKDSNFESDLMNSYAWDTAIDFMQKCDDRTTDRTKPYSQQNSLNTGSLASQGTNNLETKDQICNVYDMASNCYEWITETYSNGANPCVNRGGGFSGNQYYTSDRNYVDTSASYSDNSFRVLLYL